MNQANCIHCKQSFSERNVFTPAGWRETQISGLCELCFEACTAEPEEEFDGPDDFTGSGDIFDDSEDEFWRDDLPF